MYDISGFGIQVNLIASLTFPQGLRLTAFADDADPVDMPSVQVADKAMGVNGDLVTWSKANPFPMTVNLIPGSEDDRNMQVLAKANRAGKGRRPTRDVITATVTYPDGTVLRLTQGKLTDAIIGNGVASSGRQKTKPYIFAFEDAQ